MRKNPRRILSPQRLPFRHPGNWHFKLNESKDLVQHHSLSSWPLKGPGVGSVSVGVSVEESNRCSAPFSRIPHDLNGRQHSP
jgi:hypothetical protein